MKQGTEYLSNSTFLPFIDNFAPGRPPRQHQRELCPRLFVLMARLPNVCMHTTDEYPVTRPRPVSPAKNLDS